MRWCRVNFQCRSVLLLLIVVGQGPTALAVGAGGDFLNIFSVVYHFFFFLSRGRSGGAMVLGKLPVPGRPTIWMIVGQGPPALAVGVVWTFLLSSVVSLLSPCIGRRPDID